MAFSEVTIREAWARANGTCECTHPNCHRAFRCGNHLVYDNRGKRGIYGAWEAHHKVSLQDGGSDSYSNCEILCYACYLKTTS